VIVNPLKYKGHFMLKNEVRRAKRTQHFTVTKINWLTMLKEIIGDYEKNTEYINTKCRITDCSSRW
jgi:hypothetical protein